MQPENLKLGGGLSESVLHPLVLAALILAGLLIFLLPKRYAVVAVLVMAFMVPIGQQLVISGSHVLILRIVILLALIRAMSSMLFSQSRAFVGGFNTLDKVFLLWSFFHIVAFLMLFSFAPAAFANQVGFIWDTIGGFLVLRFLIQDEDDIDRVIATFAFLAGVLAVCMLIERYDMVNVFGLLGGMRAVPEMRDGLVRAQATFSHPLLAGTFGATLLPLFFLYWNKGKSKAVAIIGILGATIMVICASSSTPFLAYAAGIGAVCFWPFRKQMRLFRWGIVIVLVAMQVVMKAPVWFVIGHISLFGSSSSDHRAYLVDMFIRHFNDWWLMGTNSAGTWGWDMWDTSNQYVAEGESGGLAAFICFIWILSICFSRIGKARKAVEGDLDKEWYFWFLGAALFSHVVGFFGISYFDQTRMTLFALIVLIVTATVPVLATNKETELQTDAETAGDPPALPTHPWLDAPARKGMLGQPGRAFKPRQS